LSPLARGQEGSGGVEDVDVEDCKDDDDFEDGCLEDEVEDGVGAEVTEVAAEVVVGVRQRASESGTNHSGCLGEADNDGEGDDDDDDDAAAAAAACGNAAAVAEATAASTAAAVSATATASSLLGAITSSNTGPAVIVVDVAGSLLLLPLLGEMGIGFTPRASASTGSFNGKR
jgi:hypothetical protein